MNTKLKARVAAETLTDGSIVFNVMLGDEEFATPPTLQEAQRIAEDFNLRYFKTGNETLAHTPPPWFMRGHGALGVTVVDDFGNIVAECPKFGAGTTSAFHPAPWHSAQANARLMSAAPELLSAARLAVDEFDSERGYKAGKGDQPSELGLVAIATLKAAIHKATGSLHQIGR